MAEESKADAKTLHAKIEHLNRSRGSVKGQLTRFARYFDECDDEDLVDINVRYDKFKMLWSKFENLQLDIEALTDRKDEIAQEDERLAFENEYFRVDAVATRIVNSKLSTSQDAANNVAHVPNTTAVQHAKLPKLKLPEFRGNFTEWLSFWNRFERTVHNNEALSDSDKLVYLKSVLKDEPSTMLAGLEETDDNYGEAVNLLKSRYHNVRYLVSLYLNELFDFVPLKTADVTTLLGLIDSFKRNLTSLKTLGQEIDGWDTPMGFLLLSKLDPKTSKQFYFDNRGVNIPNFDEIVTYLQEFCQSCSQFDSEKSSDKSITKSENLKLMALKRNSSCGYCHENHKLYFCPRFGAISPQSRLEFIKKSNRCINCLGTGHKVVDCNLSLHCQKCKKRHHTLLHLPSQFQSPSSLPVRNLNFERNVIASAQDSHQLKNRFCDISPSVVTSPYGHPTKSTSTLPSTSKATADLQIDNVSTLLTSAYKSKKILLFTAQICVEDDNGQIVICRALLDSGSECSIITHSLAKRLNLPSEDVAVRIKGVGLYSNTVSKSVNVKIASRFSNEFRNIDAMIMEKVTGWCPQSSFHPSSLSIPDSLPLADPKFNQPGHVDILLGNDIFVWALMNGRMPLGEGVAAIETIFGWIVGGCYNQESRKELLDVHSLCSTTFNHDESLERFWELEEYPQLKRTDHSDACVTRFRETTSRDPDGRFVVRLLRNNKVVDYSHSRKFAHGRLNSLEDKLRKNPEIKKLYCEFLSEYLKLGHMVEIPFEHHNDSDVYYIPHHFVLKDSPTTNLRVVFDASTTFRDKDSLNKNLLPGPKLQPSIVDILIRFRTHRVALVSDIEKMYRQILIAPEDSKLLRILWRNSESEPVSEYQLMTVTYGLTDSPFLAISCLNQLANENRDLYPKATRVILEDTYVDDIITGASSIEDALNLQHELRQLLLMARFNLNKWASNHPDLLKSIPIENQYSKPYLETLNGGQVPVLGVKWNPHLDEFQCQVAVEHTSFITKRSILSHIAKFFDPFGLFGPVIVRSKILMQRLWLLKLSWDENIVDRDIRVAWTDFITELPHLNNCTIPRYLGCCTKLNVVGYCDASELAYGICVYGVTGEASRLIIAKSRVAPLKRVTLARLELCGAVLLVKVLSELVEKLSIRVSDCHLFTDSQIVLAWLSKSSYEWKTFVGNRVEYIHSKTRRAQWHYICSKKTPRM